MIKIRSIMTKDVVTITKNSSITEAAKMMTLDEVSSLVVVEKDKPVAILSEIDVIKGVVSKRKKVGEVMSNDFMAISPSTKFSEIIKILRKKKIKSEKKMGRKKILIHKIDRDH